VCLRIIVYSVENASPVVGRVPESNSLAPLESNSQRNSPELETANVLEVPQEL
jgi:hypothetical protein